jgi:hypothetical protein
LEEIEGCLSKSTSKTLATGWKEKERENDIGNSLRNKEKARRPPKKQRPVQTIITKSKQSLYYNAPVLSSIQRIGHLDPCIVNKKSPYT